MIHGCDDTGGLTGAKLRAAGFAFDGRYVLGPPSSGKDLTPAQIEDHLAAGEDLLLFYETDGQMFTKQDGQLAADAWQKQLDSLAKSVGKPDLAEGAGIFAQDLPRASGVNPEAYMEGVNSVIGLDRSGFYGDFADVKAVMDAGLVADLGNGSMLTLQTSGDSSGQWDARAIIRQYGYGKNVDGILVDVDEAGFFNSGVILSSSDYFGQYPKPDPPKPKATRHVASGNETLRMACHNLGISVWHAADATAKEAAHPELVAFTEYLGDGNWGPLHVEHAGPNAKMPKGLVYYS